MAALLAPLPTPLLLVNGVIRECTESPPLVKLTLDISDEVRRPPVDSRTEVGITLSITASPTFALFIAALTRLPVTGPRTGAGMKL